MLSKKYRLPVAELRTKKGATIRSRYFLLRRFPSDLAYSRFAVTVSKRVYLKATKRNWFKRVAMEHLRTHPLEQVADYWLSTEPAAATLSNKSDIIKALDKIFTS